MPNPRAQKPLSYEQIIKDAKSLGVPAQALLDALAGGVKGSVSATVGAPADIYNLLNQASFRGQLPTAPYGSEDISKMLPDVIPTEDKSRKHSAEYGETMGSFIPTPMAGQALKGAVKLGAKGARALGEEAGRRAVMGESFTPFVNTAIPQTHVVKPKGGNWFTGEVEKGLKGLKQRTATGSKPEELLKELEARMNPEEMAKTSPEAQQIFHSSRDRLQKDIALNNWVDKNLTNYVKNQMGTPDDPVRKLAEEGIVHKPFEDISQFDKDELGKYRAEQGFPPEGLGKSPQAQAWENESDFTFNIKKAKGLQELPEKIAKADLANAERIQAEANLNSKVAQYFKNNLPNLTEKDLNNLVKGLGYDEKERLIDDNTFSNTLGKLQKLTSFDDDYNLKRLQENQWINKVSPDANIYSAQTGGLGFDHILDVLKEDVANGRLRPESLKNVSMEQAVRRTYEYDQEMAKKMAEAQFKVTEGMPVHKEYPEGYKWIELARPDIKEMPSTHQIEPYESKLLGTMYRPVNKETRLHGEGYKTEDQATKEFLREHAENQLAEALKYEGETMGHCVGGYCPDVLEGRSRIYSLRDAKGEPHVTVETGKAQGRTNYDDMQAIYNQAQQEANGKNFVTTDQFNNYYNDRVKELQFAFLDKQKAELPERIVQIKGKGNAKPVDKYLPMVQDFVKSGNWSDVGDFNNTGMFDLHNSTQYADDLRLFGNKVNLKLPRYLTNQEADILGRHSVNHRLAESAYPESKPIPEIPEELRQYQIQSEPPVEGMKQGGAVSISTNPDTMYMELMDRKFAGGGAIAKLTKALAKTEKALPDVLPRAKAITKEEIRPYAQKMSEMMEGKFVRPDPSVSQNPAGKSLDQWKREQTLKHDIRPTALHRDLPVADIEKQLGMLKMGISGDTTVAEKVLHEAGPYKLDSPTPLHGGPLYGLGGEGAWASNNPIAKNVQQRVQELSRAHNDAPVLGQYMAMGKLGSDFAQHFADSNLRAIDLTKMTPQQIEMFDELIRKGSPKSGPRPTFPGIEDKDLAYMHFQLDPELRKHFNALMQKPDYTKPLNLPDGRIVHHAITEPELRDLPVTTTGFSQMGLNPNANPEGLVRSVHPTYSHVIPMDPNSQMTRTKYPVPAELEFRDVFDYAKNLKTEGDKNRYRPEDMTRVLQTSTPRQIIDPQHIDEIKMYEELMKEYTGKKKGGAIKKAKGGAVQSLETNLPALTKTDYHSIDKLMAHISKEHKIPPQKLHDDFVAKHHMTPDTWIKRK